jgi:hypothetical protein
MFPFYKKQHLILLALPLAIGTFLSLHQSFLVSSDNTSSTNDNAMLLASSSAFLLEDKERNRRPDEYFGQSSSSILPRDDDDDDDDDNEMPPKIAWLLSFPNSGTSYTMTMVEQATNKSTASNYGIEVTDTKYPSVPVHANHPEGPYWEGTSIARRIAPGKDRLKARIRELPDTFVLTKTHCGGRCVHCSAKDYVVANTTTFLRACARTTARLGKNLRVEALMDPTRVARVVHLMRNPFTNIVARFHLEGRNMMMQQCQQNQDIVIDKDDNSAVAENVNKDPLLLPMNATGFATFCRVLDERYAKEEQDVFYSNPKLLQLLQAVPCRAEFYKYVQWHNYVGKMLPSLGGRRRSVDPGTRTAAVAAAAEYVNKDDEMKTMKHALPVLTLYYEHFHSNMDVTARRLLQFLHQEQYYYYNNSSRSTSKTATPTIRPFRNLPTYEDHFSAVERQAAIQLMRTVSTPWTWERIRHYLE